jgi:peptidoglycan/LPS O-acetylase OafA/YrhL
VNRNPNDPSSPFDAIKERSRESVDRIAGLDSLRFVAAMWVVIGHVGMPPLFVDLDRSRWLDWGITSAYNNLVSGPAAVIVFFVISGFCIHYPYATGLRFSAPAFFLRRYIRIGVPLAVAVAVSEPFGINLAVFEDSILWSLVAELIYYTLYPVLVSIWKFTGRGGLLLLAYIASLGVILSEPTAGNYPSYGWKLNWLLGLPCWLLGVLLAEKWAHRPQSTHVDNGMIWRWRLRIIALSALCSVLRFHSPLGYPWTLNLFAIAAYFWIDREIARAVTVRPLPALESGGRFSYSIYIFHFFAIALYAALPIHPGGIGSWVLQMLMVVAVSYAFYFFVEYRAHQLARVASGRLRGRSGGMVK